MVGAPSAPQPANISGPLGEAYKRCIVLGDRAGAVGALKTVLAKNPAMRQAAESELARLTDAMCKKDFISRAHRSLLEGALR